MEKLYRDFNVVEVSPLIKLYPRAYGLYSISDYCQNPVYYWVIKRDGNLLNLFRSKLSLEDKSKQGHDGWISFGKFKTIKELLKKYAEIY